MKFIKNGLFRRPVERIVKIFLKSSTFELDMAQLQKATAESNLDEMALLGNAGQTDRRKTRQSKRANSEIQNLVFQNECIRLYLNTRQESLLELSAPVK